MSLATFFSIIYLPTFGICALHIYWSNKNNDEFKKVVSTQSKIIKEQKQIINFHERTNQFYVKNAKLKQLK